MYIYKYRFSNLCEVWIRMKPRLIIIRKFYMYVLKGPVLKSVNFPLNIIIIWKIYFIIYAINNILGPV